MEQRREVRIPNVSGLHARPCSAFVSTAQRFRSELRVLCDGREANGKSILEMMTLCAPCGVVLQLVARGEDAAELLRSLGELVESGFGEGG